MTVTSHYCKKPQRMVITSNKRLGPFVKLLCKLQSRFLAMFSFSPLLFPDILVKMTLNIAGAFK